MVLRPTSQYKAKAAGIGTIGRRLYNCGNMLCIFEPSSRFSVSEQTMARFTLTTITAGAAAAAPVYSLLLGRLPSLIASLLCLTLLSAAALANDRGDSDFTVSAFKPSDHRYLQQGYERINELTKRHFGSQLQQQVDHDLELMQRLLDSDAVGASDRRLLQDMGIVMGRLLEQEQDLRWVVYQDKYGRSRALQLKRTDNTLFPITMISRRAEVGVDVDIKALYQKAYDRVDAYREAIRRAYY